LAITRHSPARTAKEEEKERENAQKRNSANDTTQHNFVFSKKTSPITTMMHSD
jgi:hypothetical protein